MSLPWHEELMFIHQLPLQNVRKTSNGFKFSCCFCNEGKSPWKTRCNIIQPSQLHNHGTVSCFNCGIATNVKKLIEKVQPSLVEDYERKEKQLFIEDLKNGSVSRKLQDKPPVINIIAHSPAKSGFQQLLKFQFNLNEKYFKPAIDFEEARNFCKERKIYDKIHRFKYCTNTDAPAGGMVIFPFYTGFGDTVYGFQGRHPKDKRFHTFSPNECFKVYGVFEVNKKKPVIICESIIDSFAVENSIAMVGADLSTNVVEKCLGGSELIFASDNDSTGLDKADKYAALGYRVLVWPDDIHWKDFNDLAVKAGWENEEILQMIMNNSFKGPILTAKLMFKRMKKR